MRLSRSSACSSSPSATSSSWRGGGPCRRLRSGLSIESTRPSTAAIAGLIGFRIEILLPVSPAAGTQSAVVLRYTVARSGHAISGRRRRRATEMVERRVNLPADQFRHLDDAFDPQHLRSDPVWYCQEP